MHKVYFIEGFQSDKDRKKKAKKANSLSIYEMDTVLSINNSCFTFHLNIPENLNLN